MVLADCHPREPVDYVALVQTRVQRSVQSPFYSLFREEATRHACTVAESKLKAAGFTGSSSSDEAVVPSVRDDTTGLNYFPFRNEESSRRTRIAAGLVPEYVTLIGGTGFFGKFVAEQYLNRGISVTVLARDVEKAKSIFIPIASGEREQRSKESRGYVLLPGYAGLRSAEETMYEDELGRRRVLRYRYSSAVSVSSPSDAKTSASLTVSPSSSSSASSQQQQRLCDVTLEIVEGDVNCREDVEFSVRHATTVYYLAPAIAESSREQQARGKWYKIQTYLPNLFSSSSSSSAGASSSSEPCNVTAADSVSHHGDTSDPSPSSDTTCNTNSSSGGGTHAVSSPGGGIGHGGFLRAFDASRRVDAHFVSLTPLWVHGSWCSPMYWYRRCVTHPRGFVRAVRYQEQTLLERGGTPAPRCYFGTEEEDADDQLEERPVWRYWLSILRSTKLPDDLEAPARSSVRFSLFRLCDVVYPAFNSRIAAVKNNRIDSAMHVHIIEKGDLDARLLANTLGKCLALCHSVVEGRIDIAGRLRGAVDMHDTSAVLDLFNRFRNEE